MAYYYDIKPGVVCPVCRRLYLIILEDLSLALCKRCGLRLLPVNYPEEKRGRKNGRRKA